MPIGLVILLLLIGLPLVEITVFIEVGSEIGAAWTILLTIATAIAGSVMLRIQGLTLLTRMRREMDAGLVPGSDLVEGALIVVASILLLIPGFVTDAFGLLLFVPPVRSLIAGFVIRNARVTVVNAGGTSRREAGVVDLDADEWQRNEGRGRNPGAQNSPWIADDRQRPDDEPETGNGRRPD
ncbi:FxsA family protein [Stappia sp.]|uniref:FxsA family protein n=1 Tax=Stappia sp. TaxID=1870903 RepID=UPI003A990352